MSYVADVDAGHDVYSERIYRKCPHALEMNSCRWRNHRNDKIVSSQVVAISSFRVSATWRLAESHQI